MARKGERWGRVVADEDSSLLARAQSGDLEAFEALMEAHRHRVYGVAARILKTDGDAEEVTQEAFLSAWRGLSTFRGASPFGAWVTRIAANFALMRLRHRKVVSEVEEPSGEPSFNERGSLVEMVADWSPNALERSLDAELRGAIEGAAARLPDDHREVFVLRDVEGLSYEEIAALTGSSIPAVKSRLHRARLALRSTIDDFYREREG
jgi:RNA polymerase sigma-70 factor (ECF subfamily)